MIPFVLLLAAILLIAVLIGLGLGGSVRNLAAVQIRMWPAFPGALALQAIPIPAGSGGVGRLLPVGVLLFSYVVLIVVTAANWQIRGFRLLLLGVVLNFVVIGANHGMPVSEGALREAGSAATIDEVPMVRGTKHHLASERDVLLPLADTIPVRAPFGVVVSPGDLAMYVGAAVFLGAAMLWRSDRSRLEAHPEEARPATR
jgi:hypothetical protein